MQFYSAFHKFYLVPLHLLFMTGSTWKDNICVCERERELVTSLTHTDNKSIKTQSNSEYATSICYDICAHKALGDLLFWAAGKADDNGCIIWEIIQEKNYLAQMHPFKVLKGACCKLPNTGLE